jgi:hypothetical protein
LLLEAIAGHADVMRRFWRVLVAGSATLLLAGECPSPGPLTLQGRAYEFAPYHYQDVDDDDQARGIKSGPADFITRFDFDGDWRATNNWEDLEPFVVAYQDGPPNAPDGPPAHAYYSVAETSTHWFFVYLFFHPRDWDDHGSQEHENDSEGLLAIVRKDGTTLGRLDGIVTVAHEDFFSYVREGSPLEAGDETIDGDLATNAGHPLTAQEAKGHGLLAWPEVEDFTGEPDQDGVIYRPFGDPGIPDSANDRSVSYELIDILAPGGLWQKQITFEDETYGAWGTFRGDTGGGCGDSGGECATDAAHAPWRWDDEDDGPVLMGEMALDPAHLACEYFDGVTFATTYVQNRYIEDLKALGGGFGDWPSQRIIDLYAKVPRDPSDPTCS